MALAGQSREEKRGQRTAEVWLGSQGASMSTGQHVCVCEEPRGRIRGSQGPGLGAWPALLPFPPARVKGPGIAGLC